jgi:Uma2 family endonuclease
MALTVGDRPIRLLTADEVVRMVEAGILGEDDSVELLEGLLTEVSPKSPEHGTVIARLVRWLVTSDPDERYEIRSEHPFAVPDRRSLPEPDVAVIERGGAPGHPTAALLVVEVAVSSLATDVHVKSPLYATAAVPEHWVVDVPGRRVLLFDHPAAGRYRRERAVRSGSVRPRSIDVAPLQLTGLFAGL